MNPLDKLWQYGIKTTKGEFTIFTNQDQDTLNACLINWEARRDLNKMNIDEMRQSLIDYINSKNWAGFYAVKDEDEYYQIINK